MLGVGFAAIGQRKNFEKSSTHLAVNGLVQLFLLSHIILTHTRLFCKPMRKSEQDDVRVLNSRQSIAKQLACAFVFSTHGGVCLCNG
ncbi:MAG: hypothetical protein RSD23_09735, partial [Ruthenibacterium sp.]